MTMRYLLHVCLFFFMLAASAARATPVLLPDSSFDLQITPYLSVYEDVSGRLSIEDILDQDLQLRFTPTHSDVLRFKLSGSAYWLRFSIVNPHSEKQSLVLAIANNRLDKIDFYQYQNGVVEHQSSGESEISTARGSHLLAYPFLLEIEPKESLSYFVRIESDAVINTQLLLQSADQFLESQQFDYSVFGIVLGWIFATAAFFFFIWWQYNLRFAFFSALYCISILMFLPAWIGQLTIWFSSAIIWQEPVMLVSIMLSVILQAMLLLALGWQTKNASRAIPNVLYGHITLVFIIMMACLILPSGTTELIMSMTIIASNFLFAGILLFAKSDTERAQVYLCTGHVLVGFGTMASLLTTLNFLSFEFINDWAALILPLILIAFMVVAVTTMLRSENTPNETHPRNTDLILPDLLSRLGHEFRTPINGVLGMSELLSDTHLTHSQRDFLETINLAGRDLLSLVNEMTDFAKLQNGRITLEHRAFDLTNALSQCLARFQQEAIRKQVELVLDINDEISSRLIGDKGRLQTIISNLIGHSLRHTENGELELRVFRLNTTNQRGVFFQIQLTGSLIEHDELRRLLRMMAGSADDPIRPDLEQGLGLIIVKRLVALMSGSIEVETLTNHGCSITLFLPLTEERTSQIEESYNVLEGMRILVVDDNATFRSVVEKQVKRWGMRADASYSAKEALALMRNKTLLGEAYDFVVIDHDMPIMNGIQLTERLMSDESISPKPVRIMLTGLGIGSFNQEAREAGIQKIINKPVSGRRLKEVLVEFTNHMRAKASEE